MTSKEQEQARIRARLERLLDRKIMPRSALKRVLSMAREMSHCNAYGEYDEDGEYLGVDPLVQRDLDRVAVWLGLVDGK